MSAALLLLLSTAASGAGPSHPYVEPVACSFEARGETARKLSAWARASENRRLAALEVDAEMGNRIRLRRESHNEMREELFDGRLTPEKFSDPATLHERFAAVESRLVATRQRKTLLDLQVAVLRGALAPSGVSLEAFEEPGRAWLLALLRGPAQVREAPELVSRRLVDAGLPASEFALDCGSKR